MDCIRIEPSKHKPSIVLDPEHDLLMFEGASFPEDAIGFFTPIVEWIRKYCDLCDEKIKSNKTLRVTFKLSYLNSASLRAFLEIFHLFKQIKDKGMSITIDWYNEKNDSRMLEGAQELSEIGDIPINYIEIE